MLFIILAGIYLDSTRKPMIAVKSENYSSYTRTYTVNEVQVNGIKVTGAWLWRCELAILCQLPHERSHYFGGSCWFALEFDQTSLNEDRYNLVVPTIEMRIKKTYLTYGKIDKGSYYFWILSLRREWTRYYVTWNFGSIQYFVFNPSVMLIHKRCLGLFKLVRFSIGIFTKMQHYIYWASLLKEKTSWNI